MPLYPVDPKRNPTKGNTPITLERNSNNDLDLAPLYALKNKELWWDSYLVIDRIGLAELVEASGGVNLGEGVVDGIQALSSALVSQEDPLAAVKGQATLLGALCRKSSSMIQSIIPETFSALLSNHIMTDLDIRKSLEDGQRYFTSKAGVSCEFPGT